MRNLYIVLMIAIFMVSGCSAQPKMITGTVVDAETGNPIEGAVVLAEWTKAEGLPGLISTKSYKVVEAITDSYGKFTIENVKKILIGSPDVVVYKKGYVCWSNRLIFPNRQNRTNFKWGDYVFRLEKFKEEYSYIDHTDFIRASINSSLNLESKQTIYRAFYWEDQLASKERDRRSKQQEQ